jgi:hypothetical protein
MEPIFCTYRPNDSRVVNPSRPSTLAFMVVVSCCTGFGYTIRMAFVGTYGKSRSGVYALYAKTRALTFSRMRAEMLSLGSVWVRPLLVLSILAQQHFPVWAVQAAGTYYMNKFTCWHLCCLSQGTHSAAAHSSESLSQCWVQSNIRSN